MAAKRAAQLERERKIEDALATVLAGADTETAAAAKRDQAITAAHTAYEQAVTDIAARSATALRMMRELDEPVSAIADMTGLTRARITELLKHTDPDPTTTATAMRRGMRRRPRPDRIDRATHAPRVVSGEP